VVINSKYEWKPGQDKAEKSEKRWDISSIPGISRGAKQFASLVPALQIAQELVRTALVSAASAFPKQRDYVLGLSQRLPASIRPPRPMTTRSAERVAESLAQAPLTPVIHDEKPLSSETEHAPQAPFATQPLQKKSDIDGVEVESKPSTEKDATSKKYPQKPGRTRFVARAAASQGYNGLALSIYDELIAQNPDDIRLKEEAEEIRSGQPLFDRIMTPSPELPSISQVALFDEENLIRVLDTNKKNEITLSWKIAPQGRERAEKLLGQPGELYLRIFQISADPASVVRSDVIEYGPVKESDWWTARDLVVGSVRSVAIGLKTDQRFAAITHISFTDASASSRSEA
jgi:hypothetical protein